MRAAASCPYKEIPIAANTKTGYYNKETAQKLKRAMGIEPT